MAKQKRKLNQFITLQLTSKGLTPTIRWSYLDQSGVKVLRGSYSARIDGKGRFKLPTAFRALIEAKHGSSVFLTSVDGESVSVYPMPVWLELEERVLARMATTDPARQKFLDRVNYFGQAVEFDAQGRVMIPPRLREAAGMSGEVDVIGAISHLQIWNHDRFAAKLQREPFTVDDSKRLSE